MWLDMCQPSVLKRLIGNSPPVSILTPTQTNAHDDDERMQTTSGGIVCAHERRRPMMNGSSRASKPEIMIASYNFDIISVTAILTATPVNVDEQP
jgi:hypothetical protein